MAELLVGATLANLNKAERFKQPDDLPGREDRDVPHGYAATETS